MEKFFKLGLRGTDKKTEIIAGLTTFMTMAYVLAVQPAAICGGEAYITDVNGVVITKSAIMITCALVSGLITLLMAFYTNFPFALSTGMGSNFILGALIQSQALSFGAAMAITLISGIIFVLLTVFGLRDLIVRVIPKNIKIAISASIGFFIAYLGFKNCGIGSFENGIALGNLTDPAVLLDEITANLDAETEERVLDALRHASKGRTVLSVSHRVYESLGGRTVEIKPQNS